jgi:HAD superfamily hydrolase (TIGR01549 family)
MRFNHIQALTLDLDDTLWPVGPVIAHAERCQRQWLEAHAPATAAAFSAADLRQLRAQVDHAHPEWAHDLTALRRATLRRAVALAGEPVHLADQAFEVFFAARNEVSFYPDVLEGLQRLARRFPLLSLSNGNADLHRVGVGEWFMGSLTAGELGFAKPDPRAFTEACRRLGRHPSSVLHVGDDLTMDVRGAASAGVTAAWVRRLAEGAQAQPGGSAAELPPGTLVVADLHALADALGC